MALCDKLEQQTQDSIDAHQLLVETLLATLTTDQEGADFAQNWARLHDHFDTLFTTERSIDALKQTILQLAVMGKLVPQDPNDEPASKLLERIAKEKAQLIKDKKIKKQKDLPPITEEEKPFDLPKGWEWCRLGKIFHFTNGFAFKSEWFSEYGVRLLRNINIAHGETRWTEVVRIPFDMQSDFNSFKLAEGDIVISLDRPIIKTGLKFAVIQKDDLPCMLLQRVAKFHCIGELLSNKFLSIWLNSNLFIDNINPGRSNGIPHISTKQLENMIFPVAPLIVQTVVVDKIDELFSICEQLKQRLQDSQQTHILLTDAIVEQAL